MLLKGLFILKILVQLNFSSGNRCKLPVVLKKLLVVVSICGRFKLDSKVTLLTWEMFVSTLVLGKTVGEGFGGGEEIWDGGGDFDSVFSVDVVSFPDFVRFSFLHLARLF